LLRPRKKTRGPLGWFFGGFNRVFSSVTNGYVKLVAPCHSKECAQSWIARALFCGAGWFGGKLPRSFLPEEDQGYVYLALQLPDAASLDRTDEAARKIEDVLSKIPGIKYTTTVVGFSLLSIVQDTYSAFFFVTLEPWEERKKPEEQYEAIKLRINKELAGLTDGIAFAFPPPAIPGVGTSGGFTFLLQDRAGKDIGFLADNLQKFMAPRKNVRNLPDSSRRFCLTCRSCLWMSIATRCSSKVST
jgi:Cation/multidrug efflux pump